MQKINEQQGWMISNSYMTLPDLFYVKHKPTPVVNPKLVIFNKSLAVELGLRIDDEDLIEATSVFSGNILIDHNLSIAQAYAGHQFGHFTNLGDGRAVLLGEQTTLSGERVDVQLKGAGPTAYSRRGDGRAGLGPMLREYLISEAMFALGISTTRSLAVVTTGEDIFREKVYPGAILTRIASSHIRVGTFQYAAAAGTIEDVRALADYTIDRHYQSCIEHSNPYLSLLEQVIIKQAKLIAKWQLVGFIHGVMNTDNMSICGETIDYGPCAFLDRYDPKTVFSSIDHASRYAFSNQGNIGLWNLTRFAETLLPLISSDLEHAKQLAQSTLAKYDIYYKKEWFEGMCFKIGIEQYNNSDAALIDVLLLLMEEYQADYTSTFYHLTKENYSEIVFSEDERFITWRQERDVRFTENKVVQSEVKTLMEQYNPVIIPRNKFVEEALYEAVTLKDYTKYHQLLHVLKSPYTLTSEHKPYLEGYDLSDKNYKTYCGT